jgi:hypothetical protein
MKKVDKSLKDSVNALTHILKENDFEVEHKFKKSTDEEMGQVEFNVKDTEGMAKVGPFLLVIKNGTPTIVATDGAKTSMTRLDAERGKLLKVELSSIQEDVLDMDGAVDVAINKRDEFLNKQEKKLDNFIADLSPLQISMLKNLLVNKYRKLN